MRKNIIGAGAIALAGLGLVGVGAGASFTDSVTGSQKIDYGTVDLTLRGLPGATVVADAITCAPAPSLLGSTASSQCAFYVKNTGTLPISAVSIDVDAGPQDTMTPALSNTMLNNPVQGTTHVSLFPNTRLGTTAEARAAAPKVITLSSPLAPNQEIRLATVVNWTNLDDTQQNKVAQNVITITAADLVGK